MDEKDLPQAEIKPCDYCKKRCVWARFVGTQKPVLVELAQGSDGNIKLELIGKTLNAKVVPVHLAFGNTSLHKPHIANCPKAPRRDTSTSQRRGTSRRARPF